MDDATTGTVVESRSVDAGRATNWWREAWALFTKNAGMWIVLGLILLVIFIVLSVIPFLGGLVASLLMPVFVGSWMTAAGRCEGARSAVSSPAGSSGISLLAGGAALLATHACSLTSSARDTGVQSSRP